MFCSGVTRANAMIDNVNVNAKLTKRSSFKRHSVLFASTIRSVFRPRWQIV
jgi:hypothetical protein